MGTAVVFGSLDSDADSLALFASGAKGGDEWCTVDGGAAARCDLVLVVKEEESATRAGGLSRRFRVRASVNEWLARGTTGGAVGDVGLVVYHE